VGVSVVNALSEWLRLTIRRDGRATSWNSGAVCPVAPLKVTGKTERRGTEVHFLASVEIFGVVEYHFEHPGAAAARAFVSHNGVKIQLVDQRFGKRRTSRTLEE